MTTRQAGSGRDVCALEFHLRTVLGHWSLGVVGNYGTLDFTKQVLIDLNDGERESKSGGFDICLSLVSWYPNFHHTCLFFS